MGNRKSDTLIVPKKLLITVEGRGVHFIASSKPESCRQRRTDHMVNELLGIQYNIAKANVTDRKVQNLASYINVNSLKAIHRTMDKNKASGIDKVTKEEYEQNLEENLENLVKRMKNGSYRPNPTRRVYIPKETKGRMSHRTLPLEWIFKTINAKLRGHYQYYGVTDNTREVKSFLCIKKKLLFKWLNRRSQKRSYTWETFNNGLLHTFPLLEPSIKVSLFYR